MIIFFFGNYVNFCGKCCKVIISQCEGKGAYILLSKGMVCLNLSFQVSWVWLCLVMQGWLCWCHSCQDMVFCIQCCGGSNQTWPSGT